MKRFGLMSIVGLVCALGLSGAQAQDLQLGGSDIDAGHFSIGGRAMYFNPKDANESKWHGGAQARLLFSPALGLEGSIDYRRSDYAETQTDIYPVQASLVALLLPGKPITPILLAGAGWYFTHIDGPPGVDETQHRFGPHVGAGLLAFMNKSWSVDATYRYVWVEDIASKDAALIDKDYRDSGSMVTVGLNYHF